MLVRKTCILFLFAALLGAGSLRAQQFSVEARIAGLESNEEYMSLLREDAQLQMREDSIVNAVERARRQLRENPAGRQQYSQDILQLESRIFEIRNAKGRLIDRINTIEQEWVLANLNGAASQPAGPAAENPAAEIPDSLKVRNLVSNPYFREQLPEADYAALVEAQRLEFDAVDYVNRYFANYGTISELAEAYAAAQAEADAAEIYDKYKTLQGFNRVLADSLSDAWNYIFDNKSYAYGYLMDKLGRDEILSREEERLSEAARQLSELRGETASDAVTDYFLRKKVLVGYETSVADMLGLTSARDSLRGVTAQLEGIDFRLPRIDVAERYFLDYDSVSFSSTPKYSYQHPIPECKVYEHGTIYRILLGTFNTKRAVSTFRGAYPLSYLVNDDMLNGVVMMILCTCVISSMLTDWSSRKIILRDKELPDAEDTKKASDEKILIPVKYPEYADNLMSLAFLVRNQKLNRGLVCLNVVYDDKDMRYKQEQGRQLLDHCSQLAAATDVMTQTQVRIAANIANGIKHAFNEFQCSEIIIGMHMHPEVSPKFWGEFHQSLFNGLSRQIIMARIKQPLNTIRRIQVAVPSRAEFEPGFYRWVERLARLSGNLDCRIQFHGREETLALINEYITNRHQDVRAEYTLMQHWNEMPQLASHMSKNHLFVVVTARKGTVSHKSALERLPEELTRFFSGTNLMIIFPDQHGDSSGNVLTFAEPQHQEEISAYVAFNQWFKKKFRK